MNEIKLRPVYIASVSGGKDSMYMLFRILENRDKYPLDMVVHFELEIDYPWVKDVVNIYEEFCKRYGIKFVRIKPRVSYQELFEKYGLPTRRARWCNGSYKLDCERQLTEWLRKQECRPVEYIGFCADETQRFKVQLNDKDADEIYPLAELGITEDIILEWAKNQPFFGNWYKLFKRQGCICCPNVSRKELAYILKYYPDKYDWFIKSAKEIEDKCHYPYFGGSRDERGQWAEKVDKAIRQKWLPRLEEEIRRL